MLVMSSSELSLLAYGSCEGLPAGSLLDRSGPSPEGVRCVFDAPYLLVDARAVEGPVLRIGPYERGLPVQRWEGGWLAEHRDYDPLPDPDSLVGESREAFAEFWRTMPEAAQRLVPPSACHRWTMLRALRLSEMYESLLRTGPTLAWILAAELAKEPLTQARVEALAGLPRAEILSMFAPPPRGMAREARARSGASVRFVDRVALGTKSHRELRVVREALGTPKLVELLRHRPAIPLAELELVLRHPRLVTRPWAKRLLDEILARPEPEVEDWIVVDFAARSIAGPRGETRALDRQLSRARNLKELRHVLGKWVGPLRNSHRALALVARGLERLPEPELEGTDAIVPIRTVRELLEAIDTSGQREGPLLEQTLGGELNAYRVLAPERATLWVTTWDAPCVRTLSLAHGGEPCVETWDAVRRWFRGAMRRRDARLAGAP